MTDSQNPKYLLEFLTSENRKHRIVTELFIGPTTLDLFSKPGRRHYDLNLVEM